MGTQQSRAGHGGGLMLKRKPAAQFDWIEQQAALLVLRLHLGNGSSERLASALSDDPHLGNWLLKLDYNKHEPNSAVDVARYRVLLQELERNFRERCFYPPSIDRIGQRFGLTHLERKLLWFGILQSDFRPLRDTISAFDNEVTRHMDAARLIERMIDVDAAEVTQALLPNSRLVETGLISQSSGAFGLNDFLDVPYRVAVTLRDPDADDASLLRAFLTPAKTTALSIADYPHIADSYGHLVSYLRSALEAHTKGVNVLLHGIPGAGKTEFAAVLTAELGVPAFAVPDDVQATALSLEPNGRLASYRMTQALLTQSPRAVIVFDDVEDGLLSMESYDKRIEGARKASLC